MSLLKKVWTYIFLVRDLLIGASFLFIANLLPPLRPDRKDLNGHIAIVTGSNSGVGYGIALDFARQRATVVLACRNEAKAVKARETIISSHPGAKVDIILLDTSSFDSVQKFAKACRDNYPKIDILVHNAGISGPPDDQDFSKDGFEIMYQTNFLSSFLLTHLLESCLSESARIVFTSSIGSYAGRMGNKFSLSKTTDAIEPGFHGLSSADSISKYAQNKLMQAAFAKRLQLYFDTKPGNQKLVFSFEPGLVKTNIFTSQKVSFLANPAFWLLDMMMPYTGVETSQGAATGVHLATSSREVLLANRGRFFDRMKARTHWVDIISSEQLDRLWIRWCADCEISWV